MSDAKKIFLVAGEQSGDVHGANLVSRLKGLRDVEVTGTGGRRLAALGQKQYFTIEDMTITGIDEVLTSLPFILKMFRVLKRALVTEKPDLVVLIDYPGFNLRFAAHAKALGIPVVTYIAPQVWVWHYSRVEKMRDTIDKVLCILPFEEEIFQREGIDATYVGNPISDSISVVHPDRASFCAAAGIDPARPIVGLLPGSRRREIRAVLPAMVAASRNMQGERSFVLGRAESLPDGFIDPYLQDSGITVLDGLTHDVMKHADILWSCSGTATLEAAILGTPMVIMNRAGALTSFLYRKVLNNPMIGLPNIVLGREVFPELVQQRVSAAGIIDATRDLESRPLEVSEALGRIGELFSHADPSLTAAKEISSLLDSTG